jgi:hypothetical protein
MSKVDWSKAPKGAEFFAGHLFRRDAYAWCPNDRLWLESGISTDFAKTLSDYELRPTISVKPTEWPTEQRIDIVGTNGGDGMHYDEQREAQSAQKVKAKSKYHRVIKGVEIDVYDVLKVYGVTCPAIAHAIKKLLLPGERHAKTWEQDINEAIASLERARELRNE